MTTTAKMTDTEIARNAIAEPGEFLPVTLGLPYQIAPDSGYGGSYSIIIDDGRGWLRLAIGFQDRDYAESWLESGTSWEKSEEHVKWILRKQRRQGNMGYYMMHE